MRILAVLLIAFISLPAAAQGFGPPSKVLGWKSKKNQQRLILGWDGLPEYKPTKLPDGSEEPPEAPWPFLIYVRGEESKGARKIQDNVLGDARFRFATHAVKAVRMRPEKALDLPYLRSVQGIKDPTLIVLKRDFTVVGKLSTHKDFTSKKLLPLMAKASDDAYQIKLGAYVGGLMRIMKDAEKLWTEELAIEALATRGGRKDPAKQKQIFQEVEEREQALARREDLLLGREEELKGRLILKAPNEIEIPTTVGKGRNKRELTPEEIEAIQAFREFARSSNPVVRAAAVEDLGGIDSGVIASLALKAANDVDMRVVKAAGVALGRMKSIEAIEVMFAGLTSPKQKVRIASLLGFANGGHNYRPAAPVLVSMLAGSDDEVRRACLRALGAQKDPSVNAPLVAALDDRVPALRVMAAGVIGERRQKDAVPALLDKLDARDWSMRKAAVDALARIRAKESIGPLIERFQTEKGLMREALYNALVSITGQDFRYRTESWDKWWKKYGAGFQVPTVAEIEIARARARDALKGYARPDKRKYHKIETLSTKMVFVIDISSSMRDKIVVPPSASQKARDEFPDRVKMEIAKREMIEILSTLDKHVYFNIVTFAGRVKTWRDGLVSGTQRNSAIKFVEKLKPIAPARTRRSSGTEQKTNTYGALLAAFGLADSAVPNWRARTKVDTIFLVTDGLPTIGTIVELPKLIRAITEMNRTRGVTIHVITFDKQSGKRLKKLATQNGGQLVVRGFD